MDASVSILHSQEMIPRGIRFLKGRLREDDDLLILIVLVALVIVL